MARHKRKPPGSEVNEKMNLAPMIDIVFLLLTYFMVTTAIQKEEADLGLQLPIDAPPSESNEPPPHEAVIGIFPSGEIQMNTQPMDNFESRNMPQLTESLRRQKQAADAEGVAMVVTIQAADESPHQRAIDALNAAAAAGINIVSFGDGGG